MRDAGCREWGSNRITHAPRERKRGREGKCRWVGGRNNLLLVELVRRNGEGISEDQRAPFVIIVSLPHPEVGRF